MYLYGTHYCSSDEKSRVMLPVDLKEQLKTSLKKGFIIKQSIYTKSLELFPMASWNDLSKDIKEVNKFSKDGMDFLMMFNYGVRHLELDSSGRFLIPKDLVDYATIKKDVVMAAVVDRIIIWDRKMYDKYIKDKSAGYEALTDRVMVKKNPGSSDAK